MPAPAVTESAHETRNGALTLQHYPDSALVVARVTGYFGSGLLPPYLRLLSAAVRGGPATGFHRRDGRLREPVARGS
jgi:hypothetical protein